MEVNWQRILINEVETCTSSLMKSISQDDEFKRGLLLLSKGASKISGAQLQVILEVKENYGSNLDYLLTTVVHCEDDGETLCLHNAGLSVEDLKKTIVH